MDQAQANQYNSGNGQNNGQQNYAYNPTHNDPFQSFINTDDEGAFDNSWQTPDFSSHQPSSNHDYDQNVQHWQQAPYQASDTNFLSMSQYGVDPRYSSNGSNFQYPNFGSTSSQDFSGKPGLQQATFPGGSDFHSSSLSNAQTYQYPRSQEAEQTSQTISPAAITSYPDLTESSFSGDHDARPSQKFSGAPASVPSGGLHGKVSSPPLSILDWRQLASRTVKSIDRPGLHIKPTNQYENATRSKRFNGFIFVGDSSIALNSSKANIPRYKRKKSRNEARRLLQIEKGDGPWHPDREHIVKRLKTAAKKQGGPRAVISAVQRKGSSSSGESSESESDDSSEYYSESEPEKEPDEPSPLPSTRPADPHKAVEYDVIKATWAKRSSALSGPVIRTALGEVWDILKGVRDKWKAKATNLQQAIDKKDQATEKAFERRVAEQRRLLEACNVLILKHGHPGIVEKLGENPVLLVVFYQFLADRIKYSEYGGTLVSSILELMSRCPNIDSSLLEKTKVDKLLPRILKRGDDQGKRLTQQILQNAKLADKKFGSAAQVNGTAKKAAADTKVHEGVRKENQGPIKRTSVDVTAKTSNSTNPIKGKSTASDPKAVSKIKLESSSDTRTKVVNVAAKPSGFFSSLKSASKRPGTSTKSEDGSTSIAHDKKTEATNTAPKPAFSFAATMAGLAKQKEEAPSKVEESRKPESAEEKRRRLRKESRRKLRVSFKSDDELVSIRTFEHDPEEEIGHDQSQVRDVGDSKGEGQMLKMHKDLELDDEEDYEPPEEILPSWTVPQPTDFSTIDEADRARSYLSRGGTRDLELGANERDVQRERENGTLMAIYASAPDIPITPREPTEQQSSSSTTGNYLGEPWQMTKTRETEYQARKAAQPPTNAPSTDISALLHIMSNAKQQPQTSQQAPTPPQQVPEPNNPLAAILAKFSQNPQPQPSQSFAQQQAPLQYNLQAALANMQQPPQQGYQPQPAYGAPPANAVPNLHAILSQFGNQGPAPQAPSMQNYGYNNNQSGYPMNEDRKRQMETEDHNEHGRKRARGGKPFTGVPHLPCKFWQEGKCRKGDDCTFLHE